MLNRNDAFGPKINNLNDVASTKQVLQKLKVTPVIKIKFLFGFTLPFLVVRASANEMVSSMTGIFLWGGLATETRKWAFWLN
jgi:hypothetical protein